MDTSFQGKRALVTGASQGIGKAIVLDLVKKGASVIALSRTKENLDSLMREVPGIEKAVCLDVSNWKETESIIKSLGDIDLLVNNAGVISLQSVGSITEEEFDRCFSINVKAVVNISQIVANNMKKRGKGGSIVNISSQTAMIAIENHATYCASKGALDQLTKVMALELAPYQIRVNTVNPTVVLTEMGKKALGNEAEVKKAKIPLGRFCVADDIVGAVAFLLSDKSSMITGAHIPIDGHYQPMRNNHLKEVEEVSIFDSEDESINPCKRKRTIDHSEENSTNENEIQEIQTSCFVINSYPKPCVVETFSQSNQNSTNSNCQGCSSDIEQIKLNQKNTLDVISDLLTIVKKNEMKLDMLLAHTQHQEQQKSHIKQEQNEQISEDVKLISSLPVGIDGFIKLNERILENIFFRQRLISILSTTGGKDLKACVANILRKLILDDVGEKFSLTGKSHKNTQIKESFEKTEVYKLVLEICINTHNGKENVVREVMSDWLVQAKFRKIRREQRLRASDVVECALRS